MRLARMPVLFVGHGNPMNAIEHNEFHRGWHDVARRLPTPRAVLCVSALRDQDESLSFFNTTVLSSISMTSVLIGG